MVNVMNCHLDHTNLIPAENCVNQERQLAGIALVFNINSLTLLISMTELSSGGVHDINSIIV